MDRSNGSYEWKIRNRGPSRSCRRQPLAYNLFFQFKFTSLHKVRQKAVMGRGDKNCLISRHKELVVGTLRSGLGQAGMTFDVFVDAYKK